MVTELSDPVTWRNEVSEEPTLKAIFSNMRVFELPSRFIMDRDKGYRLVIPFIVKLAIFKERPLAGTFIKVEAALSILED